ncbi:hypothetical protein [Alkalihalobacillus sp. 1P02AB]
MRLGKTEAGLDIVRKANEKGKSLSETLDEKEGEQILHTFKKPRDSLS